MWNESAPAIADKDAGEISDEPPSNRRTSTEEKKPRREKKKAGEQESFLFIENLETAFDKFARESEHFESSRRSREFRLKFYPSASHRQWNDWRWQLRNRVRRLEDLSRMVALSPEEHVALEYRKGNLPVGITPYYASMMDPADPAQPLRRTMIPVWTENVVARGESEDPLGEDHQRPAPGLVHRYPDRVLFLVTEFCAAFCRYCTRSRLVGNQGKAHLGFGQWERAIEYIRSHTEVRDVLLSGGDPLTLDDEQLDWLLGKLRGIPHVEFIRIGTKTPVVLPQRITRQLTRVLRRHHPLWVSIHFTHPDEITPETAQACERLADAGIPLGSQTVLLKGINDSVDVMKSLYHKLLRVRVKPYYLYQCDPISGSSHFRTPVEKGLEIIRGLRGHTTGYACPTYVIDAPGGGGKIPLLPDYYSGREDGDLLLRNFEGNVYRYPDASSAGRGDENRADL